MEAARDALAADMFALVAKETQLAHTLLQYVKLQRAYHESALHSLQDTVPELERFISKYRQGILYEFSQMFIIGVLSGNVACKKSAQLEVKGGGGCQEVPRVASIFHFV